MTNRPQMFHTLPITRKMDSLQLLLLVAFGAFNLPSRCGSWKMEILKSFGKRKCFFLFQRVPGVASTMVGYTAGSKQHPSYNEASSHAKQPATKNLFNLYKVALIVLPLIEWSFTGWFSLNPHCSSLQIGLFWIHWSHWGRPDALQPWLGLGKCCYKSIF